MSECGLRLFCDIIYGFNPKNFMESLSGRNYLEQSFMIDEIYDLALSDAAGDTKSGIVVEKFKDIDRASVDCHSFSVGVMNKMFDIPLNMMPKVDMPDRCVYPDEVSWRVAIREELRKMVQTPEGSKYWNTFLAYINSLKKSGIIFDVDKQEYPENGDFTEASKYVKGLTGKIVSEIRWKTVSRMIHLIDSSGEELPVIHSCVVLGETKEGDDLFVLEKEGVGTPPGICELSEIVLKYCGYDNVSIAFNEGEIMGLYARTT